MDLRSLNHDIKKDVISEDYSKDIINNIDYNLFDYSGRGIIRYGYKHYTKNLISDAIPDYLKALSSFLNIDCTSISINRYRIGDYIPIHRDVKSCNSIYILSLLSECDMIFVKSNKRFNINLPANSLFCMTPDIIRLEHLIEPVKNERISIVFRS